MTVRIVQRARARQDVLALVAHIAAADPKAAEAFFEAYQRALTTLAATPEIGWPIPRPTPICAASGPGTSAASAAI